MDGEAIDQRRLLGGFLRAHRERLTPASAGLQGATGRRRTPGLRREEIAQLAGISSTWYAWIEQGREVSVSPHALARVAKTLQLTGAERAYMFELSGKRDPASPAPPPLQQAPASLAAAVERFEGPAYGLDRLWNACCWNSAAADLFEGWLSGAEPNLLRWMFLDPGARRLVVDWPERARRVVAEFRVDFSRSLNDPQMRALVQGLADAEPQFAR